MRMLMHVEFPIEPFNSYVRDGSAGSRIKKILADAKPEAVYFTEHAGKRGGWLVINLEDSSMVPAFAEPWFLGFHAIVEFRVAMTPDELSRAGLEALGQKWG